MGTYSKVLLSGSTDGAGVVVTGTNPSQGTVAHTAVTGAGTSFDEVWLYAYNTVTTAIELAIAIGPTTATGSRFAHTITGDDLGGLHLILPGLIVRNSVNVKAYVTAANNCVLFGYVNRFAS